MRAIEEWAWMLVPPCYFTLAAALDLLTSSLPMPVGAEETNIFTRDIHHQFMLGRGVGVKLLALILIFAFGYSLFLSLRGLNDRLAKMCFGLTFWYFGTDILFHAVLPNLLLAFGWFQT